MYVCQLSLLIWAGYRHFKERLPEAIYSLIYCLRLFIVVYKLVMFMERG